jgi:cell division protease FtsH
VLGFTLQPPMKDKYLMSKEEILDRLAGMLGGRAAEELVFNKITTGASNDLENATKIAKDMVCRYGMSDKIGPVSWGEDNGGEVFLGKQIARMPNYSEETASTIDQEIKRIIEESYKRAFDILKKYRDKMNDIAKILLEKETIEGEELDKLLKGELELDHNGNDTKVKDVARENN